MLPQRTDSYHERIMPGGTIRKYSPEDFFRRNEIFGEREDFAAELGRRIIRGVIGGEGAG